MQKQMTLMALFLSTMLSAALEAQQPEPWKPQGEDEWKTRPADKTEEGKPADKTKEAAKPIPAPITEVTDANFPEVEARVMAALEKENPDQLRKLLDLKDFQPADYKAQITDIFKKIEQKRATPKMKWGDDQAPNGGGRQGGGPGGNFNNIKNIEAFLEKNAPEELDYIKKLRDGDPKEAMMQLRDLMRPLDKIMRLEQENPARFKVELEGFKLEVKSRRLAKEVLLQDDPGKKETLMTQLKETLQKALLIKEHLRELDIEQAKKDLAEQERLLKVRTENKDEIVRRRIEELMGDKGFEW